MRGSILRSTGLSVIASAALMICAPPAQGAGEFNVNGIFAMPARSDIDSRCIDARRFAALAAKPASIFDTRSAMFGEQAFEDCVAIPRLAPDEYQTRYLVLAAAGAAYMAAQTASDDSTAIRLYQIADDYALSVGADGPAIAWKAFYARLYGDPSATILGYSASTKGTLSPGLAWSGPGTYASASRIADHLAFGTIHRDAIAKTATALHNAIAVEVASLTDLQL